MKFSTSNFARIAGIVLVFGIVIQILYDPISSAKHSLNIINVRNQFPQARAKWEALGITNYTFEIQGNDRSICQPDAMIEVKNEIVVRVETKDSPGQILSPDQWADEGWGDEVFLCNYGHFTMTQIFDLLDRVLQDYPSSIMQADFDPKYGFLTDFNYGIYVGYGLLKPQINDCCNVLTIKNFQPVAGQRTP